MHYHHFLKTLSVIALGTLGISFSFADKITLTSGKTLEGRVLKENGDEYLIEVQVTRSIKDRKTIKKSDILSIEKTAQDAAPYEELKDLLPTKNQMRAGDYRILIEGKLVPFIAKFPRSQHLPEVKETLATLRAELKRVEAGDIKLDGTWTPAAEWNANAFDLDSLITFSSMERAANAGSYQKAMLFYDQLKEGFPSSEGLTKARDLARKILPTYQQIISTKASSAKQHLANRKSAIANLPARDRARAQASLDRQITQAQAIITQARKDKTRWIPAFDFDARSLQTLERAIKSELTSLNRIRASRDNLAQIYRDTYAAAGNGDSSSVERSLNKFKSKNLDPKYATLLSDHLAANPAPKPTIEKKPEPQPQPLVEDKPKPKTKPKPKPILAPEEPQEEEGTGIKGYLYSVLSLAISAILIGVLLKSRKSNDDE